VKTSTTLTIWALQEVDEAGQYMMEIGVQLSGSTGTRKDRESRGCASLRKAALGFAGVLRNASFFPRRVWSPTMNVDKCVALHNKILEHGFLQSGRTIEDLQRERKTWFDNYGDKAEAFHGTLSSDLIAFLERVYVTNENNYSFFYYVSCLYWPEGLFEDAQCLNEADYDESSTRYVALYMMNMFSSSHRTGVV
jgi:hypothetical protein